MAALTDRLQQTSFSPPRPAAKPPRSPKRPIFTGGRRPSPEPPDPWRRILAALTRVRALGLGTVAAVALAVVIALGLGSGEPPPATGAAQLVPGNALLYLHVSTDTSRPGVQRALVMGRRLPGSAALLAGVTRRVQAMLSGSAGAAGSFAAEVRPWLGKEASLAVLDTSGASAGSLVVLDVRRRLAAERFLAETGARSDGSYRGIPLLAQPAGAVLAFVRHYLVLGQASSVQAAIDVAAGRAPSLADSSGYERAAAGEPADRVLDAYASADGIRRALTPRPGLLGDLGALLDQPALSAATISVSALSGGVRVAVHSTLDPRLASQPPFRPVGFAPGLAAVLPAGSFLLDVKGLHAGMPKLLAVAARAGIAGRLGPLLARLGSALVAQGVDLGQVLSIFSGETAIGVTPARGGNGPAPVIVTHTAHEARTRAVLANLEGPLTQVFAPTGNGPGQVPEVNDTVVAGVPVHELSLAPGFGLDYTVAHGLVVVSTGTSGIAAVFHHSQALADSAPFRSVVADHPDRLTSLVFLDLSQLLRLGGQMGLISSSTQNAALWPAVESIHAVGLASWRGADDTTTELQLQIP